ncbi:MAG: TIGR00282 family metallophosphoesterase [Oscillospiraceae bacterium]|jgi:metallophosphoesterase (TIGR00282 family)|nr:TIGR00282 family metallophosphoesterase [Oscillospiraceae bacterium]
MKILFIGDVVGQDACEVLCTFLPNFKHELEIGKGAVIINGENSADGNGITPHSAKLLFKAGADVITTGNHCFKRHDMDSVYRENPFILRPANFGENSPGKGVCLIDRGSFSIAVINLAGITFMAPADNPFKIADELLETIGTKNVIVDFHAEATAEKKAMGYYLAGKVSAVLCTHTHVQTADEQIINSHTAYITDVGMTGALNSVLGVDKDVIIERFLCYYPKKHSLAAGKYSINAVLLEINEKTGKTQSIQRINRKMH